MPNNRNMLRMMQRLIFLQPLSLVRIVGFSVSCVSEGRGGGGENRHH